MRITFVRSLGIQTNPYLGLDLVECDLTDCLNESRNASHFRCPAVPHIETPNYDTTRNQ